MNYIRLNILNRSNNNSIPLKVLNPSDDDNISIDVLNSSVEDTVQLIKKDENKSKLPKFIVIFYKNYLKNFIIANLIYLVIIVAYYSFQNMGIAIKIKLFVFFSIFCLFECIIYAFLAYLLQKIFLKNDRFNKIIPWFALAVIVILGIFNYHKITTVYVTGIKKDNANQNYAHNAIKVVFDHYHNVYDQISP